MSTHPLRKHTEPGTHPCGCSQDVAAALTDAPAAARPGAVARELQPNLATAQEPIAATNLLAEVDRAAQDVISAVTRAQVLPTLVWPVISLGRMELRRHTRPQSCAALTMTPQVAGGSPGLFRQALAAGGPAGRVDLGADAAPLELVRSVGPAELRRHKRDFLRLATQV